MKYSMMGRGGKAMSDDEKKPKKKKNKSKELKPGSEARRNAPRNKTRIKI